jgi:hypothetical protein
MTEPDNQPATEPANEIPDHELDYLDDREPRWRSWQDRAADDAGVPRWGPI